MNACVYFDSRETKLLEFFNNRDNCIQKQLDIGDILFTLNDETVLIIERKTISDLYSSIKDGRYKEQKCRLFSHIDRSRIIFLIEGDIDSSKHHFNKDIIYGSVINTLIRDNVKILKSKDINESIKYIEVIIKRLATQPDFFTSDSNVNQDYASTIKMKKKNNMTPEMFQITQLAQIPGMSTKTASIILAEYTSVKDLIYTYKDLESEEAELLLSTLEIKGSTRSRKLGKVLSKRVYDYIYNL